MDTVNGVPVVGSEHTTGAASSSHHGSSQAERQRAESLGLHTISHSGVAPPLDFSFQDLANMSELVDHEPNGGARKPAAASSPNAASAAAASSSSTAKPVQIQSGVQGADPHKRTGPKAAVTGVRLAYNELSNLSGFVEAMELLLGPNARTQLTWLDLSHNRLTTVDDVLFSFPNLTSLYLHGNQISSIAEVRKLHVIDKLAKLTMHGNPIYQQRENHGLRNPRSAIIYNLRNCPLKSLDFITITNQDRRNSLRWAEQNKPKKAKRRTEGEEGESSPVRR